MKKVTEEGSITVFLTFLLPLILALIGTLLEAARIHTAEAFLTMDTEQSMQMMFSDYNKELWQEYHIFAYTEEDEEAVEEIKRGILMSISEEEENSLWKTKKLNFWHLKLSDLSIESKEMLTDEDGEVLKHEVIEYEKYQISESLVEGILKLLGIMKKTGAAAHVVEEKMKAEEELYDYSEYMLEFMEIVDGIDFGKTLVQYSGKKLEVKDCFVKQFLYGSPNQSTLGFENNIVWDSLKNSYYNSKESLEELQKLLKTVEDACIELKSAQKKLLELQNYQGEIKEEKSKLQDGIGHISEEIMKFENLHNNRTEGFQKDIEEEQKGVEKQKKIENQGNQKEIVELESLISNYQSQISKKEEEEKQLEKEIDNIQKKLKQLEKAKKDFLILWEKESSKLREKAENVKKCVKTALNMIPELKKLQQSAKKSIEKYQNAIEEEKTELFSEMYQSFSEDCKELAASVGLNTIEESKEICDLNLFETYLHENEIILQEIKSGLFWENSEITQEEIIEKMKEAENLKKRAENYHITEFIFSYKMILENQKQENPIETLKKLGDKTLLSLVVKDINKVSKQDIKTEEKVFPETKENEFLKGMKETLPEITVESNGVFSALFGEFSSNVSENIEEFDSFQSVGQSFLQKALLNQYVQDVFFSAVTEEKNEKVSTLRYEQEYILSGKDQDKENLSSVVKRVAAIRLICNYMSLLSDSKRQKEAYAMAAAIAGFTGLEPLVEVLKNVILLIWAYEEGLVDTAALLQGKKIPIIKTPSQISLSLQELLTFGREMIQKKSEALSEDKTGCGYAEYLYIMFCIQKQDIILYRLADMIQMNIRIRYNETFLLNKAIFGCKIKASYSLPTVFFRIPFVSNIASGQANEWNMEILSEMAY